MKRLQTGVAQLGLSAALLLAVACGSNSSSNKADSGTQNNTGTDSGNPGSGDGDSGSSPSGDGDAGNSGNMTASCSSYCTTIAANCSNANAQYQAASACQTICATFPTDASTSGNTLACRAYHAQAAAQDPATHCSHAGLTGGDNNPGDNQGGPCGEACDAFCNAAVAVCTTTYADKAACMTECKSFPASTDAFSSADTSGNNFNCRAYHLSVAATDAQLATKHCPHIVLNSPVCQ